MRIIHTKKKKQNKTKQKTKQKRKKTSPNLEHPFYTQTIIKPNIEQFAYYKKGERHIVHQQKCNGIFKSNVKV